MRLLAVSDSHGSYSALLSEKEKIGQVDAVIHLGDFARDGKQIAAFFDAPLYAVRGNCDWSDTDYPKENIIEPGGVRLLLTHGHRLRSELELGLLAEEVNCSAVLFGHTHTPLLSAHGPILLINPGSLSQPRYGSKAGYAILTIENRDLKVKMVPLC